MNVKKINTTTWVFSGILLVVWGICYLPHLRTSPGWYGDEFITMMGGRAILDGSFFNRALKYSFFSTYTNYQPPGLILYVLFSKIFSGGDILGARFLSTLLGLSISLLVLFVFSHRGKAWVGFAAALTILVAPQSVIHFRWVYPHYFVSLGVVLIALALDGRPSSKKDWLIGVGCGIAAMGHLLAAHVIVAALIARGLSPRSWLRIGIPPAMAFLFSLSLGYYASGGQLFLDLQELAAGYSGDSGRSTLTGKFLSIYHYFSTDWLHEFLFLSFFGLALMRKWGVLVFTALISFAIIQNRPELPVFYYQSMVFIPALCINLFLCLQGADKWLKEKFADNPMRLAGISAAFVIPALMIPSAIAGSVAGSLKSRNAYWVAPSAADIETSTTWINEHSGPDDLIISYWDAGWLLKRKWTDPMQCAIWSYGNFPYFYNRLRDHAEFVFPADFSKAKYVLIGTLDMRWTYGQGTIPKLLEEQKLQTWPVVYSTPTTAVVQNPRTINGTPCF
jgi:hypothetical protein